MSIKIELEYLKHTNNAMMLGSWIEFDNFNLLSKQVEQLLLLQLRKKEKLKLKFLLENKALVILYEDIEGDKEDELTESALEDRLIDLLQQAINEVDQYLDYLAKSQQKKAIIYNVEKRKKPSKMQAILSKLASETVTLTTDSGLNVCISKTDKFSDVHEEQSTAAINCRITKPELINTCKAEFHYSSNEKKHVATLDIPAELVEDILNCAIAKVSVDIEFEYFEKINAERKYTGCLTAFKIAKKAELETVTENLF